MTLADQAYDRIERMIVTLELPPGAPFSEASLAATLDLGRTPIREALQRLVADRLVLAIPKRGMQVTDIDVPEYLALLETRAVLDRLTVGRAATRVVPDTAAELRRLAADIQVAATKDDTDAFMLLDRQADLVLAEAAANPFGADASRALHAHARRFWYQYRHAGDLTASAVHHAAILLAVAEGDKSEAEAESDRFMAYLEHFTREAIGL